MLLPVDLEAGVERAEARAKEQFLRSKFREVARVTNLEKGYVSVPFVNQLISLKLQGFAADLVVYHCWQKGWSFDKVVQIPNSGNPLATSVAERMGVDLVPGRKGRAIPGAWNCPIVVEEEADSFTTGERSRFVFNGLEPDDKVLLIDDVIAYGYTSKLIIKRLEQCGINCELAVYFAKLFHPGLDDLKSECGIEPFFVVGIAGMNDDGTVELAPPHF